MKKIIPGSKWLHKNGNIYTVLLIANSEVDKHRKKEYPLTIVYTCPKGKIYSKKYKGFLKSRTPLSDIT